MGGPSIGLDELKHRYTSSHQDPAPNIVMPTGSK